MWWKVVGGFAITDGARVRSMTLFRIVAEVGLESEPRQCEQGCDNPWLVQGMMRIETLHSTAMSDDVVAQLQVVVMPGRLIAEESSDIGVRYTCIYTHSCSKTETKKYEARV